MQLFEIVVNETNSSATPTMLAALKLLPTYFGEVLVFIELNTSILLKEYGYLFFTRNHVVEP